MRIANLEVARLHTDLRLTGLTFHAGPFIFRLHASAIELPALLGCLYADYLLAEDKAFADFHIRISKKSGWFLSRQPLWHFDTNNIVMPHVPFPEDTILPFLEWGINWRVANQAHHYLMLHAGMLEKNGSTLLLPAQPGSGKSTLCAALYHRGWRLLTDEIALVRPADLALVPFPTPDWSKKSIHCGFS